jgi:hypothetical protein
MFRCPPFQVRDGLSTDPKFLRERRLGDLGPPPSPSHAQTQLKGLQEPLCPCWYVGHGLSPIVLIRRGILYVRVENGNYK